MPAVKKQKANSLRSKKTSGLNNKTSRQRSSETSNQRRQRINEDYDNSGVYSTDELYDNEERSTARPRYSSSRTSKGYHREGNIIQRAADKIREVLEDLTNMNRDRDYDKRNYRSRNEYNSELDYETSNWRRRNYDELGDNDPEHHFRDKVHRQPYYDDGRNYSHYNDEAINEHSSVRRKPRSSAEEWRGRNRRPGSRYSSSDNYHARNDEYEHEYYDYNRDRD